MSVLEVRGDTATIVVERELKSYVGLPEGGTLQVRDSLAYSILNELGLKRLSVWNHQDLEAEDKSIYFKVKQEKLEIQLKGSFFVFSKNWEARLNQVLKVLRDDGKTYRFSRFDVLYLTRTDLFSSLRKTDFKNLETNTREKKSEPFWFNTFSTIFGVVFYDKQKQLKKIKKQNPEYVRLYGEKFGTTEPLYHFELRQLLFRRKDKKTQVVTEFVPSSNLYPFDFKKVRAEIEETVLSRVGFHKTIKNLIKEAP